MKTTLLTLLGVALFSSGVQGQDPDGEVDRVQLVNTQLGGIAEFELESRGSGVGEEFLPVELDWIQESPLKVYELFFWPQPPGRQYRARISKTFDPDPEEWSLWSNVIIPVPEPGMIGLVVGAGLLSWLKDLA